MSVGFDKDLFVADCLTAVGSGQGAQSAVRDIVERAVSTPGAIEAEVRPRSESPMMTIWHRSDELTVLHIVWPPNADLFAHDHNMWAVIGVYGGREDNQFYRQLPDGRIEPHAGKTLLQNDVVALGSEVVHSVRNPTRDWTATLHVYGGEFFTTPRTMWSKDTFEPMPLDPEFIKANLETAAADARLADEPGQRP
ncbi:MAG: hypothetical protein ACC658_12625 [Acidimicrobiia bacterium]